MDKEEIPNPVGYIRDLINERKKRKEFDAFYTEQFHEMVANGNVDRAVQLVWDEAENLDFRLEKPVNPEILADYCMERCSMEENSKFSKAAEKLSNEYRDS